MVLRRMVSALIVGAVLFGAGLSASELPGGVQCNAKLSASIVPGPESVALASLYGEGPCGSGFYKCQVVCDEYPYLYWGYFTSVEECCNYSYLGCSTTGVSWSCANGGGPWECPIGPPID